MRKAWLLFSQTVTVAVALLFVVATLKPEWLKRGPELTAGAKDQLCDAAREWERFDDRE